MLMRALARSLQPLFVTINADHSRYLPNIEVGTGYIVSSAAMVSMPSQRFCTRKFSSKVC